MASCRSNLAKRFHAQRSFTLPSKPSSFQRQTSTPSETPSLTYSPEAEVQFDNVVFLDTDGDGFSDSDEIQAGTDPNDINDIPASLFDVFNNI